MKWSATAPGNDVKELIKWNPPSPEIAFGKFNWICCKMATKKTQNISDIDLPSGLLQHLHGKALDSSTEVIISNYVYDNH